MKHQGLVWATAAVLLAAGAAALGLNAVLAEEEVAKGAFVVNMISGIEEPHRVNMGMHLASDALKQGREVIVFVNVEGAMLGTDKYPDTVAFSKKTLKQVFRDFIDAGGKVLVCPHCLGVIGGTEADLIEGAELYAPEKLFGVLDEKAVVFTY